MELQNGRPENIDNRLDKEIRVYDFLDKLGIAYQRVDHEGYQTGEFKCGELDQDKLMAYAIGEGGKYHQ